MSSNLSNIEVFKEIYSDYVVYCDLDNEQDLKNKINIVLKNNIKKDMYKIRSSVLKKYSWQKSCYKLIEILDDKK